MPMNPLDWTAGPFLALYAALALLTGVVCFWLRQRVGPSDVAYTKLTAPELAYLNGTRNRVSDTVLVEFLTAKVANSSDDAAQVSFNAGGRLPAALEPFRYLMDAGPMKRSEFYRRMKDGVAAVRERLERLGYVPDRAAVWQHRLTVIGLWAVPLILGFSKVAVGMERHKPVGILGFFLFISVMALLNFLIRPYRSAAGRQLLAIENKASERAARAPLANEFALAVALTGLAVLSGSAYASIYTASKAGGGSGCGGTGCGGGGGDGGGGGGCGGCGGGD